MKGQLQWLIIELIIRRQTAYQLKLGDKNEKNNNYIDISSDKPV